MLKIVCLPVTELQQNCRFIIDTNTKKSILIDPGGDAKKLLNFIEKESLSLVEIWLTHSHFDHCGGVADIKAVFNVPLRGHKIEAEMRAQVENIAQMYGLLNSGFKNCPEPEYFLNDQDQLQLGEHIFLCFFTPGHSPGHICFYNAENSVLIAGDTLFAGSIGRTDLPMGNFETLANSIRTKIYSLPDNTDVLPGHGPNTKVKTEKMTNPFVKM